MAEPIRHDSAVRVLICDLPNLQSDVIAGIVSAEPDMVLVGQGEDVRSLPEAITSSAPDVLVVSTDDAKKQGYALAIAAGHPGVGVLLVGADTDGLLARTVVSLPPEGAWQQALVGQIREAVRPR